MSESKTKEPRSDISLLWRASPSTFEHAQLAPDTTPTGALINGIRSYLRKIPHISQNVDRLSFEVTQAWQIYFYRIRATALYEMRTFERKSVPYKGWTIPPKAKDEFNIDVWSYSMPRKAIDDCLEHKTSIVSDSQSLHDCHTCHAAGWLGCWACSTRGCITCQNCSGYGRHTCSGCGGVGQISKTRVIVREEKCTGCGVNTVMNILAVLDDNPYTRARRCSTCGGTGIRRWKENQDYRVDCKRCQATGIEHCKVCQATGLVVCRNCSGNGRVACNECETCQRVVSYLEVVQRYYLTSEEEGVFPDLLKGWLKHTDSETFSQQTEKVICETTEPHLDLEVYNAPSNASAFGNLLAQVCIRLASSLRGQLPMTTRIAQERIQILRGRCIGFQYKLGPYSYKALTNPISPDSEEVASLLPHASPATRWMCDQLQQSKALSEQGDSRQAALVLAKCKEISAIDPVCNQYLQDGISELPDNVVEMSGKIRFSFAQVLFITTALCILVVGSTLGLILDVLFPAVGGAVLAVVLFATAFLLPHVK